jgi:hypothetical protein
MFQKLRSYIKNLGNIRETWNNLRTEDLKYEVPKHKISVPGDLLHGTGVICDKAKQVTVWWMRI